MLLINHESAWRKRKALLHVMIQQTANNHPEELVEWMRGQRMSGYYLQQLDYHMTNGGQIVELMLAVFRTMNRLTIRSHVAHLTIAGIWTLRPHRFAAMSASPTAEYMAPMPGWVSGYNNAVR